MPPVVSDTESEFDDNSDNGVVNITSDLQKGKAKIAQQADADMNGGDKNHGNREDAAQDTVKGDNDDDEDEEEGEEDGDEEVYVVENIVNHDVAHDTIIYNVKWQGYPHSENTWEPEENLEGASDALQAYFLKIGGRPVDASRPNAKKRGRKSLSETTARPATKKSKNEVAVLRGRRKRNTSDSGDEGQNDIKWPTVHANSDWKPPKPRKDSWEDLLLSVEALEADPDGTKWAFLLWSVEDEKGKKRTSKVLLSSVYVAAPQAILRFYESHLVFTKKPTKPVD